MRYYTAQNIDKAIAQVKTEGETLQNKIHRIAASAVVMCHNDQFKARNKPQELIQIAGIFADRINALMDNAPWHKQSLGFWVETKTGLVFSEETEAFYAPQTETGRLFADKEALRDAIDNPFWKIAPPKAAYKPLTIDAQVKALEAFLKVQTKHVSKPHEEDTYSSDANGLIRDALKILQSEALGQGNPTPELTTAD